MNSGPDDSMTISQRVGDILMAPGSCYRPNAMYHVVWEASLTHCPSCITERAGQTVYLREPVTCSPTQFHAPKQRRDRRECVPHDCGAVRMCTGHGSEHGGRTERCYWKPQAVPSTPSRTSSVAISNQKVCGHAADSASPL
jgi:hypothetical protein